MKRVIQPAGFQHLVSYSFEGTRLGFRNKKRAEERQEKTTKGSIVGEKVQIISREKEKNLVRKRNGKQPMRGAIKEKGQ